VSPETVFTNARVVTPGAVFPGTVVVRGGVIAEISQGTAARGEDLAGDHLLPGLVELHTDHLESHVVPRPGTHWDPVPAVLAHDVQLSGAGVTTVFDAIRLDSTEFRLEAELTRSMVDAIDAATAAGITRADHLIHLRCEVASPDAVQEFEEFADLASVRLASLMDHTPGQRQYVDVEAFRRYMVGKGRVAAGDVEPMMARLREAGARYSVANRRAIAALAAARGITLAAHDDATVEHAEESAGFGVRISEFPTTEAAAAAAREREQLIVMGAPNIVRGGSQSGNVAATRLLELGLLDILSSDYVPASPLQAIFQLAADGTLAIEHGARLVAGNPARAVGLDDRGEIAIGQRADLVRVHPHALPASAAHPAGGCVPVVRAVYRAGVRVS
jgi:alpha-D-ribose 1-methylphosphonate 5-triphosphate diphosphatase